MKFLNWILDRETTADEPATTDDSTGEAREATTDGGRPLDVGATAEGTSDADSKLPDGEPETTSSAQAEAQQGPGPATSSATTSATGEGETDTSSVAVVVSEDGASAASDIGVVAVGPEGSAAASEVGTTAVGSDAGAAASNAAGSTTVSVDDATDSEQPVADDAGADGTDAPVAPELPDADN